MAQQVPEIREHDHIPGTDPGYEPPPPPPHPLEQGYTPELPPKPEGDPPEGPAFEWIPTEWVYYPNEDFDNPDAVTETYYKWVVSPRHIPTPAEIELANAVALLEQLKARRGEIEAIIAAPTVRSLTIPGVDITVARFSDLEDMRANQVALSEILLDLMAAAASVVDASLLQGAATDQAAREGA